MARAYIELLGAWGRQQSRWPWNQPNVYRVRGNRCTEILKRHLSGIEPAASSVACVVDCLPNAETLGLPALTINICEASGGTAMGRQHRNCPERIYKRHNYKSLSVEKVLDGQLPQECQTARLIYSRGEARGFYTASHHQTNEGVAGGDGRL
ncbi:hypothetical protein Naga_100215g3 [Nannochloropsis gaditana]|uniref:Uncharacterized protein n=1 Tax=Nannochloropsis gaditana TaxID=72520 RepID=W7TKW9_9STRA|nr:hypothetical protein Naga_100215g3 [Nannochloropsis gaditana]